MRRSAAGAACILAFTASGIGHAEPPAPEPGPPASAPPLPKDEADPANTVEDRVILLVRTPGDDGVMTRLRADLREGQWRVLEVRPDERFAPAPLGTSAERERASAAVRVDAQRGLIDLWVLSPAGPVEETIAAPNEKGNDQVLALRVAEALRARGLSLSPSPEGEKPPASAVPRGTEQPSNAPSDAAASRSRHGSRASARLWLRAGPALSLSPGGLGPVPLAELGLRLELAERWSVGLGGFVPLSHPSVSGSEGKAEIATSIIAGLVEVEWARLPFGGFRAGIGAGETVTVMSGQAQSGYESTEDTVTTFAPLARASFHVELGRAFLLDAALLAGVSLPPVSVEFGSRTAATWGSPFVVTSVSLEASPLSF